MAPPKQAPGPPFQKDERVLCFHGQLLYEAKILDVKAGQDGDGWQFKIHYKGWKNTWDDWVPQDRVLGFTDENKELASQLRGQFKSMQSGKPSSKQPKKVTGKGSDFSSARGSEERIPAQTMSGRGPRRARDFELEQVGAFNVSMRLPLIL
jgi:mortality factor 4-like protein 1